MEAVDFFSLSGEFSSGGGQAVQLLQLDANAARELGVFADVADILNPEVYHVIHDGLPHDATDDTGFQHAPELFDKQAHWQFFAIFVDDEGGGLSRKGLVAHLRRQFDTEPLFPQAMPGLTERGKGQAPGGPASPAAGDALFWLLLFFAVVAFLVSACFHFDFRFSTCFNFNFDFLAKDKLFAAETGFSGRRRYCFAMFDFQFQVVLELPWHHPNSTGRFIQTARKISNGQKIARIAPIWTKI